MRELEHGAERIEEEVRLELRFQVGQLRARQLGAERELSALLSHHGIVRVGDAFEDDHRNVRRHGQVEEVEHRAGQRLLGATVHEQVARVSPQGVDQAGDEHADPCPDAERQRGPAHRCRESDRDVPRLVEAPRRDPAQHPLGEREHEPAEHDEAQPSQKDVPRRRLEAP